MIAKLLTNQSEREVAFICKRRVDEFRYVALVFIGIFDFRTGHLSHCNSILEVKPNGKGNLSTLTFEVA